MALLSKNSIITVTKKTGGGEWWKAREILCRILTEARGTMRKHRTERKKQTMKMSACRFLQTFLYFSLKLLHKAVERLWCNNPFECCQLVRFILIEFFSVRRLGNIWQLRWGTRAFPDLSFSRSLTHTHTKPTDGSHYLHARVPVTDGTLIKVLSGRVWQSCCIYTDVQPPYILGLRV